MQSLPPHPSCGNNPGMVLDLGEIMRRKEERESARLLAFEFALHARWVRLVAEAMGRDGVAASMELASHRVDVVLAGLGADPALIARMRQTADAEVRAERGNPDPVRLA